MGGELVTDNSEAYFVTPDLLTSEYHCEASWCLKKGNKNGFCAEASSVFPFMFFLLIVGITNTGIINELSVHIAGFMNYIQSTVHTAM